ncbi:ribosomal RNA-processing protein [Achlya hypogyna]|uniref:Ribosomal RNA-processing protein 8 n=1 Tax=Achlya hypogyna TaxID=1202772 RepID=A0A1V9ZG95_ACHHY|nr:ribosomal RNA-processing protein [Achlya hypogyna]
MTKSKNQKKQRDSSVRGSSKVAKKVVKKKAKAAGKAATKQVVTKPAGKKQAGLSAMQEQMKRRLEGGKFRMLNEQLYTTTGVEAFEEFQAEPELFDTYHEGFREMAEKWPLNPLDTFIAYVKSHPKAVVADFGCGDARLAASVPNKVHSFDLVSRNEAVTACNIANVPLPDESVDIAVYCLALMGTTLVEYLLEGRRVLKPNGIMKIAEVKSRMDTPKLGIPGFVKKMTDLGFDLKHKDESNKMFVTFEFAKSKRTPKTNVHIEMKACEYKRR